MKNKKNKYKDYEIPFWGEWLEGDILKRLKMVERLQIIKEIVSINKLPKKPREHSFALMLNSFFEDLESAIYIKIRLENKDMMDQIITSEKNIKKGKIKELKY